MKRSLKQTFLIIFTLFITGTTLVLAQGAAVKVAVDATDAPRYLLHVAETVNVTPGKFDLFYAKWIPGEHAPTGPLNNMVNLHIKGGGKELTWQRDDVEMFAFHVDVPAGVSQIEVTFDDAAEPGTTSTPYLARIKWNRLILYPRAYKSDDIQVTASLKTPAGWKYATALQTAKESGRTTEFKPVNFTTFVDSPAIIGKYFRKFDLSDRGVPHEMDIVADSEDALTPKPETLAGWQELVRQANALFGAHHYNSYKFLVTLSDVGGDEGLEHHESSEDGVNEKSLTEPALLIDLGDLLGHEFTHSWNGKYRRPARLTTPDFEQPMHADLLWVYEGLTEYLGKVLPTRSKLWTPENFRDAIADYTSDMELQTGRHWRPLVDTARAVQFTYSGDRQWRNRRRGSDYYDEGALIWLEADVLIRQKSGGKLSLDDFCHKFHGPNGSENTGAMVKTYELEDVVATLNSVLPYDWNTFFQERVYRVADHAPMGVANGGWKLEYSETPNAGVEMNERIYGSTSLFASIGIMINDDGTIRDVAFGTAADKAGMAPAMVVKKVGNEDYSLDALKKAITDAKGSSKSIELSVTRGGQEQIYKLDYHGGLRYPHLVRDASKPDLLSDIIKAR
jgi:predicted metalloprotease with PDZ domain